MSLGQERWKPSVRLGFGPPVALDTSSPVVSQHRTGRQKTRARSVTELARLASWADLADVEPKAEPEREPQ